MNVLIVCGGTGGHLFPGIAVGETLLERGHRVLLVISKKEVDRRAVERAGYFQVETLPAVGWRGWRPDHAVRFVWGMLQAILGACRLFRAFRPDVVLGMGGFSSVAPLLVSRLYRVPSCIHESNAVAGKANRLGARFASVVAVGFETTCPQFPKKRVIRTGMPVRASFRNCLARISGSSGSSSRKPTVFVVGGSQGARGLNQLVVEAARRISSMGIQWLHLTGRYDQFKIQDAYASFGAMARVSAFCHEIEEWYSAADLVIARSGASSLAEISAFGLPSILIPYPFAADQHQTANARQFVDAGAAVMWEEADCTPDRLAKEIQRILLDSNCRKEMAEATRRLHDEKAHERLVEIVEELGGKK